MNLNLISTIKTLTNNPSNHAKNSIEYQALEKEVRDLTIRAYESEHTPIINLSDDVEFELPFFDMGNINTTHLFGIDELIIIAFYKNSVGKYKKVLDLGANIGLHSIALSKLGYQVTCYEADPDTFKELTKNLNLNEIDGVEAINAAAASFDGQAEFTRVCGNLTGSHLSGAKENPYGELVKFDVTVQNIGKIAKQYDLIKIDIEGQEADVLTSIPHEEANKIDFMMEINGDENAHSIFNFCKKAELNIFLQKDGWAQATSIEDLPRSHRDGSVFLSRKSEIKWN